MKTILLILFLSIFTSCFAQINHKTTVAQNVSPERLIEVENELCQYVNNINKDSIINVSTWDEFNEDSEDRVPIPDKVFIKTSFHIETEWAGEHIPLGNVFYKTTIQLIYGLITIGDNVCNPIIGEEITLKNGYFTGLDMEKMFLNGTGNSNICGLQFQTSDFHLREYLRKNHVCLFLSQRQSKVLGRIVVRTYFGSNKSKMNVKYEKVINVIKNPYSE